MVRVQVDEWQRKLLSQRRSEISLIENAELNEQSADPLAGRVLPQQRLCQLRLTDHSAADEQLAQHRPVSWTHLCPLLGHHIADRGGRFAAASPTSAT
jgi:hypothetical protein